MFPSYVVNSANKVLSSTTLGKTVHLDMAIIETQINNVPSYSDVTPEQFSGREEFWNSIKESGIGHIWDAGTKIYKWNPAV